MKELWQSFVRGLERTLGIAQVRRYIPTPAEDMEAVEAEIQEAVELTLPTWDDDTKYEDQGEPVELPRDSVISPRRWMHPDGKIVSEAYSDEAVDLLLHNPEEYMRLR